jgi:hypothetical protein
MLPYNLALVSEVSGHDPGDVSRVAAALQRQASRDLGPIWGLPPVTVDAFPTLEDVPVGYIPLVVMEELPFEGAAGIHLDKNGQPFALIQMSDSWSLTASHEVCELLVDPWGNRLVPGESPKQGQGRVAFLVEVSDPSEAAQFGYTVNGILVSDFYTPRFFDPKKVDGVRYSFTGAVKQPRTILRGGYLSWQEPVTDSWWQQTWFGGSKPTFRELGPAEERKGGVRAWIDEMTPHPGIDQGLPKSDSSLKAAVSAGKGSAQAAGARAEALRSEISGLKPSAKPKEGAKGGGRSGGGRSRASSGGRSRSRSRR